MEIIDIKDDEIYLQYRGEKYLLKNDYIGGTTIKNYFLYGCYGVDDFEYEIKDFTSVEKAILYIMNSEV